MKIKRLAAHISAYLKRQSHLQSRKLNGLAVREYVKDSEDNQERRDGCNCRYFPYQVPFAFHGVMKIMLHRCICCDDSNGDFDLEPTIYGIAFVVFCAIKDRGWNFMVAFRKILISLQGKARGHASSFVRSFIFFIGHK